MRTIISELKKTLAWNYNDIRVRCYQLRYLNPPVVARHTTLAPDSPRVSTAKIYETEYPYRPGRVLVLRLYGPHGALLGLLNTRVSLDDDAIDNRLLEALWSAEGTAEYRAKAWRERAGKFICGHAASPDEAAMFSDMLGLDDERTTRIDDVG